MNNEFKLLNSQNYLFDSLETEKRFDFEGKKKRNQSNQRIERNKIR